MEPIQPLFPRPMLNSPANCDPHASNRWLGQVLSRLGESHTVIRETMDTLVEEWRAQNTCAEFVCTDPKILEAYRIGRGR